MHYGRDSPLRPELAESTFALYQVTGDMKYLDAGRQMLRALQANSRVPCGYASVADVETGALDDRMDSFFIAETLKYLFLLFDRWGLFSRFAKNTQEWRGVLRAFFTALAVHVICVVSARANMAVDDYH